MRVTILICFYDNNPTQCTEHFGRSERWCENKLVWHIYKRMMGRSRGR